ncbi:conserved hypothetical protein [Natronincola peptidivorans]|uniref:Purine nucleoside phosphorylase n=1 Tax=Natronincola peptidivorans TaxID=426128 RepID=A0A1H9Y974_9FIRM|nr:peptidoglycan editing factor PgeF [Natronincola peptidivorans]SES64938.1 conserved hypothetical protein [Natronincola peptidivorans]
MTFKIIENKGISVVKTSELEETQVVHHGFSTRIGGISTGVFNTLNIGFRTKDSRENVLTNLKKFCDAIDVQYHDLVLADQVHQDKIIIVTEKDKGKGILYTKDYAGVDGLITNVPGVPLMTFHADCVPLLFLDTVNKVIAATHAGWKGTMLKIGQKTVLKMMKEFQSEPKNILAAIGPSIGKCCYEVSEEVVERFNTNFTELSTIAFPVKKDKYMLDLWEANRIALKEIGVLERNIISGQICTACNTDLFYSHRKEKGITGRMAAVIALA